jgi:catechol 2,3-dioxygenase-like lactoylglutathione lyase family enzyme
MRDPGTAHLVEQVGAIGMTVSDMDASVAFYSKILSFEKVSDVEVAGEDYERLQGVFRCRSFIVIWAKISRSSVRPAPVRC